MAVSQSRESELGQAIEEVTQLHETRMQQATALITQHRILLNKMRDECRTSVEVIEIVIREVTFL